MPDLNISLSIDHTAHPPFLVTVAVAPAEAHLAALLSGPPKLVPMLTHDAGLSWPDAAGEVLLRAALAHGGGAVMGFETLADAIACRARLRREAEQ